MNLNDSDRILVPIVTETDAERTAESIRRYLGSNGAGNRPTVVVTHVIEKGGGSIDKAPLEARKEQAEELFETARSILEPAGYDVETHLTYGSDVVEAILETASEVDASLIAFLPREGGLLLRFLTGDVAGKLVMNAPVPVLSFPPVNDAVD